MDKSLCPASGSFDFTHSPHKWLPTIVSCGKHGSALSTGFNPRLRFCWRPRRLKINLRGNLMYFRKPDIRSHQLDVQETNVSSVIRFYRVRNYWVECWFDNGRATCSWHVGLGDRSVAFIKEYRITNPLSSKKLLAKSQIQTQTKRETEMLINCRMWTTSPQTHILLKASLVHLWRQWSSDQKDHLRQKSNDETRVKNSQSCAWLVIWQNQLGPQDPNQICWHQQPTRGNVDKR